MNKANIQYFDWGYIEWMYEPEYGSSTNIMHIGITTILPEKRQKKHIHYGDEQLLYVLSGKGEQLIGDTVNIIEPGSYFHIEAGSVHETVNITDKPITELLISIPANFENNLSMYNKIKSLLDNREKYENPIKIDDRIKSIYDEFIHSLKMPVSIFDNEDNVIISGQGYPEYCEIKCNISNGPQNCCIYGTRDNYTSPHYSEPSAFICPYGLTVFITPIFFNDEVIGIIKGGHIRINSDNLNAENSTGNNNISNISYRRMPEIPEARMKAISLQIKKLCKNIVNYYILENTEVELGKREEIIQDISRHEIMLEESLKSTKEKVLSIQINNHFLFNTLNAVAGLAIKENAFKTYESIINLSKMFRYSLKTSSNLVKLRDELDYLVNFVDLQKLRYGNRLEVKFNISEEIKDIIIPFNCLQPILENCFIHGFKNEKNGMLIEVSGKKDKNNIIIEIRDNGTGLDENAIEVLNRKIRQNNSNGAISGLMMIYSKLKLFYNEGFDFKVSGKPNKGTSIKITIYDKLI
ncbi:MAG: histidine kinase [Caulobacteraceae bacterium]